MKIITKLVALLLVSPVAFAGSWNYGCTGKIAGLGNLRVSFDRGTMVILQNSLASGNMTQATASEIQTYKAGDLNSGFQPTLVFTRSYEDGTKVTQTLAEINSKTVSEKSESTSCGNNRVRDLIRTIYKKTYSLKDSQAGGSPDTQLSMDCFEYVLSACG